MRELIVKTNYDVLLSHFVDSISLWDVFVAKHLREYFEDVFECNQQDKEHIDSYVAERKLYGWDAQSELFDWAFAGFPNDSKYQGLKTHFSYFENRVSKDGKYTLKDILSSRLDDINKLLEKDFDIFKQKEKIDYVAQKMGELVVYNIKEDVPLIAYLACSMNTSTQGGSNGNNIYAEVPNDPNLDWVNGYVSSILVHEYFHKAFSPHLYFEKLGGIFNLKDENVFPDPMSMFFEEVLVYSSSNVYISGENPKKKLSKYSLKEENNRSYILWKTVDMFYDLIKDYLDNKDSLTNTRERMLGLCERVVNDLIPISARN